MSECPLSLINSEISQWAGCIPDVKDGFLKSLQFSPDGLYTLSATENNAAVICSLDENKTRNSSYYEQRESLDTDSSLNMILDATIPIGESIYDLKWYPGMQAANPATKCFISTSRDHPIMLWDASNTSVKACVRCTYRGYDQADELDSAICLTFNLTGDKIYGGYNRMIRCFDVANPGKDCTQFPTSPTKRAAHGQKGLISVLAFNPDYSGAYAAGSYAHSVGVYVENMAECALLFGNIDFGVTCLRWSPCGNYLWVGGRNNDNIFCYDIRSTQSIVGSVQRKLSSNQRMIFDIDPWGKHLCTGDQDGKVLFYDTSSFQLVKSVDNISKNTSSAQTERSMCANSVAFHPYSALLGVARGERTFVVDVCASESESDEENEKNNDTTSVAVGSSLPEESLEVLEATQAPVVPTACTTSLDIACTCITVLKLPFTPLVLPSAYEAVTVDVSSEMADIADPVDSVEAEVNVGAMEVDQI